MGHMSTIYLHCQDAAHFQQIESNFLTSSFRDAPSEYIGIPQHDLPLDRQRVIDLSEHYHTEVIGLMFESVSDSFQYIYCHNGMLLRHLEYGCTEDGIWNIVEGESQPWEATLFVENPPADIAEDDPSYAEMMDVYQNKHLIKNQSWPMIDARETARAVAVYYRLSGWLDDWDPQEETVQVAPDTTSAHQIAKPWWKFW